MYSTKPLKLVKSCRRLAMEIKGKDRLSAEKHLVKYGASIPEAAEIVALNVGARSQKITSSIDTIEKDIDYICFRQYR